MIDLPEARALTAEENLAVREQLMAIMLADPPLSESRTTRRRTRPLVAGALLVCLLVGVGLAAAVAITFTAAGQSDSAAVVVGSDMPDVLYGGRRITQDDLVALTKVGLGTFTVADVDTQRDLHATRAFDTLQELDAYSAAYVAWQKAKADGERVEAWGTLHP
ncbi:hypothetical protein [Cellulomonas sp. URHD0024]|uniref:hypothetical protein n=1 Tax=Cellulomonas sp. URHD0024 TaxID=1302620 RepID=UPI00040537BA|nr:hypothetical protein [Cellulomonas sp. URHD0024]